MCLPERNDGALPLEYETGTAFAYAGGVGVPTTAAFGAGAS